MHLLSAPRRWLFVLLIFGDHAANINKEVQLTRRRYQIATVATITATIRLIFVCSESATSV